MTIDNDRKRVDRELRRLGFGGLDDPNLIPQIAFCIRDHEHFRAQLFSVLPEKRRHAYNTLRPHLRFAAKPLDVYEAEIKHLAERNQLPTYNEQTGELIPFKTAAINLDLLAAGAIKQRTHEEAGGRLELVCASCTVFEHFKTRLRKDAEAAAHRAGWRSDGLKNWCSKHVPMRVTMTLGCSADDCLAEEKIRCWDPQDGYAAARLRGWIIDDAALCPKCAVRKLIPQ